mgnify:CR=1 FL=1
MNRRNCIKSLAAVALGGKLIEPALKSLVAKPASSPFLIHKWSIGESVVILDAGQLVWDNSELEKCAKLANLVQKGVLKIDVLKKS